MEFRTKTRKKEGVCDAMRCMGEATHLTVAGKFCKRHYDMLLPEEQIFVDPINPSNPAPQQHATVAREGAPPVTDLAVQAEFAGAIELLDVIEQIKVEDQESLDFASQMYVDVSTKVKELKEQKDKLLAPIKEMFDGPIDIFKTITTILKRMIEEYLEKNREERDRAFEEQTTPPDQAKLLPALGEFAHWQCKIIDLGQVPIDYLTVNKEAVLRAVKKAKQQGEKLEIPGLKVWEDKKLRRK